MNAAEADDITTARSLEALRRSPTLPDASGRGFDSVHVFTHAILDLGRDMCRGRCSRRWHREPVRLDRFVCACPEICAGGPRRRPAPNPPAYTCLIGYFGCALRWFRSVWGSGRWALYVPVALWVGFLSNCLPVGSSAGVWLERGASTSTRIRSAHLGSPLPGRYCYDHDRYRSSQSNPHRGCDRRQRGVDGSGQFGQEQCVGMGPTCGRCLVDHGHSTS